MLRQNLGHTVNQSPVSQGPLGSFGPSVQDFLLEAGRRACVDRFTTLSPECPTEKALRGAIMDSILLEMGEAVNGSNIKRVLNQLGFDDVGWPTSREKCDAVFEALNAVHEFNYGTIYDETLRQRGILELQPLHKRVLGLIEYFIVPKLKLLKSRWFRS